MLINVDVKLQKRCSNCKQEKSFSDFGLNKTRKDGYNNICKLCAYQYYLKRSEGSKRYTPFSGTKEEYSKQYYKKHYENNKAYYRNKCAIRERDLRDAYPKWANTFFITETYDLAKLRTELTGIKWEVDHIIPIKSEYVCGLHVEHNLQVVPQLWNRSKRNDWCCEKGVQTWLSLT